MRPDEERQGPVIRDRRRIDPVTGQVRDSGQPGPQQRGPGQPGGQSRPGRHSVSQPGGPPQPGAAGSQPGRQAPGPQPGGPGGTAAGGSTAEPGGGGGQAGPAGGAGQGSTAGGAGQGSTAGGASTASPGQAGTDRTAAALLAERTADLQRLSAEYANYRKRVERDRLAVREQALANVLNELLPVLDDIGRAREHGELTGGFKSVAESLEGTAVKLGLTSYGENGDPFDPTLHEALMHSYSADVTEPTCVQILQPGYKVGERIIRPARVSVAEPVDGSGGAAGQQDASTTDSQAAQQDGAPEDGQANGAGNGDT
jgi:molecular chaperone GrpE